MYNLSCLKVPLLCLFLLLVPALFQKSCNVADDNSQDVIKGKEYVVCVHFTTAQGSKKAPFKIIVDQYTGLEVVADDIIQTDTDPDLYFQTQNNENTSSYRFYQDGSQAKLISIVLYVENGVIQKVTDDNFPFYNNCGGGKAQEYKIGGEDRYNCFFEPAEGEKNPKIFVSWMGTDKNGDYLLSHTHRISKFSQYSISDVFQAAFNIF